ncbi:MAG: hypothetical protein DKM50_07165 [Candidatus Margulisiibacteriota bacterium]|nr:MAG: hypothetical protein A2X43_12895 [Candidatus Margulisbacteria bacterium GWD2_39_127]OGI02125.1 MAG: hypothetical protein A2X42_01510 [Candidatus Margulisbacteria bacterium GWF2_38_17]OGI10501.1 MAG: hypothetical protein A2X41_07010 [Candidatus Margulisbacteria bacterium GWE2_39_32]PZM79953.1 MAG: hypothetical protein DKM50_07165 [Candidatus Margulisiibacteriota bacterium]HAR62415.1 hypothetical protein [Candidatus Margulisiibacteriota bacterium]
MPATYNLLTQRVYSSLLNHKLLISVTRVWRLFSIKIRIPILSQYEVTFDTRCKPNGDFFLFCEKNIFITAPKSDIVPALYSTRSNYHAIFSRYLPTFFHTPFNSIHITRNFIEVRMSAENLSKIIPNFIEILHFAKEINKEMNSSSTPQSAHDYLQHTEKASGTISKKLILIFFITIFFFTIIGAALSLLVNKNNPAQNTYRYNSFIQIWELYKDFAYVYDLKQDTTGNLEIISRTTTPLTEYAGFKPELAPWGFRISPKLNFKYHYKILIFPKETEILGCINFQPIKKLKTTDHLIVTYDLSNVSENSFIKIYMRYRGKLVPVDIKVFVEKVASLTGTTS